MKYLKYIFTSVLFTGIVFGGGTNGRTPVPYGSGAINLKAEKNTQANGKYLDARDEGVANNTVDKKRSHKRRRKVRPPREGK